VIEKLIFHGLGDSTNHVIDTLIKYRNKYNYPKAFLVRSDQPTELKISSDFWAKPIFEESDSISDLMVDKYHHDLLWSDEPSDNLLGTASVIFWGFNTFKHNFAMLRVKRHLNGYKTKSSSHPLDIAAALNNIKNTSNYGKSINYLSTISQLGQVPFSSKVVAFIYPQNTGVYDSQIDKGIKNATWTSGCSLTTRLGPVTTQSVQEGYQNWCVFLTSISVEINARIMAGEKLHWIDPHQGSSMWRAIDVERAFFQLFREKNSISKEKPFS
jgi:hypothetical protein